MSITTIKQRDHELRAYINGFLSDPAHDDQSANSLLAEVFRRAAASLEAEKCAEPVAKVDTVGVCWYADNGVPRKPAVGTELFSAPPAPVSAPDESAVELLATDLMKRIDKITGERHSVATLSSLRVSIVEACRAAMLQGAGVTKKCRSIEKAQVLQDYPEALPCPVLLEPGLRFGKGVPTKTMLGALQRRAEYHAELDAMTPEQLAEHEAGMKEFAGMLHGADVTTGKTLANGDAVANCPKCGGHGSYHCMQMLGTVECECALQEVKQCT